MATLPTPLPHATENLEHYRGRRVMIAGGLGFIGSTLAWRLVGLGADVLHHNPEAKIVYASTRHVYGHPDALPVTEDHSVQPIDVNGINKAAGEQHHQAYSRAYGLKSVSLRLANVYGPRQLITHNRQGFIGRFIGQAVQQAALWDDAADAFLRVGADDACDGDVFNVGGDEPICHRELASSARR